MSHASEKAEIDRLVELLTRYQYEYYRQNRPSVSDSEYDRLFDRLKSLEESHPGLVRTDSPTHRVGSDLSQDFPEVQHTIPVLSLDKCYSTEEILKWTDKIRKNVGENVSYTLEEKIDGASIVLYYERGRLARAVTRGNGIIGNNITGNVKTIAAVPLKLMEPVTAAVRGEIFLPIDLFERLNAEQDASYSNPRNLAAGTLRRIKSVEVAAVPLDIFVYEGFFEYAYDTHFKILIKLDQLGFKLNDNIGFFSDHEDLSSMSKQHPSWHFGKINSMIDFILKEQEKRSGLPYQIDGLVLKVNEIGLREKLGYTGHHPRWEIAIKFEAPVGQTVVKDIVVQIGRTGRATPVARVEPVSISGSTVSNVTLHNQEYINMLELALGDSVEVSKRGDVIPALERVFEKNEEGHATWQMPLTCPSCSQSLSPIGAHHFCINPSCQDQILGRLHFFVARGQMDVENLGPETVDYLLKIGLVKDIQDIYSFNPDHLLGEPGFREKKIGLIKEGIRKSLEQPYEVVLVSLGVPELGRKAVELLVAAGFKDIDSLLRAADENDVDTLSSIHGLGEKTAHRILQELNRPDVRKRIQALKEAGLKFQAGESPVSEEQIFAGQTWCVTGSFERFKPRELAVDEVRKRGGGVTSSVSSKTTHLLAGSGAGSKLRKAVSLGTKIVSEKEFLKLLG